MGYTHYWRRKLEIEPAVFLAIKSDFEKLLPVLAEKGIKLGDAFGRNVPVITDDEIRFNGLENCGHPANSNICIPWPAPGARGIGSNTDAIAGGWLAGSTLQHRACDGDCSYESFVFDRVEKAPDWRELDEDGLNFNFTKTAFRPYDVAVTAFLLIALHHLGDKIRVSTDGDFDGWADAIQLCYAHLGYKLTEFAVDDEGVHLAKTAA